jgi:hypothetical protein
VRLRRAWPQFRADAPWLVTRLDETGNVIALRRTTAAGADPFLVIANFGEADVAGYRIGLPAAGTWEPLLTSQAAIYGGNGSGPAAPFASEAVAWDGFAQSATVTLPRMGLLVLAPASVIGVPAPAGAAPAALWLGPPTPSPAPGAAAVAFALPLAGRARLAVFDAAGRRVRTLLDGPLPAGPQRARWDGRDDAGTPAPAGLYFIRLEHGGVVRSARLALLR